MLSMMDGGRGMVICYLKARSLVTLLESVRNTLYMHACTHTQYTCVNTSRHWPVKEREREKQISKTTTNTDGHFKNHRHIDSTSLIANSNKNVASQPRSRSFLPSYKQDPPGCHFLYTATSRISPFSLRLSVTTNDGARRSKLPVFEHFFFFFYTFFLYCFSPNPSCVECSSGRETPLLTSNAAEYRSSTYIPRYICTSLHMYIQIPLLVSPSWDQRFGTRQALCSTMSGTVICTSMWTIIGRRCIV